VRKVKEKETNKRTNVVFVIDSSGSMLGKETEIINLFNEQVGFLKTNKEKLGDVYVSLVLFGHDPTTTVGCQEMFSDSNIAAKYLNVSIDDIPRLTEYVPSGMTPLCDAILFGATLLDLKQGKNDANLMIVLTDGAENASAIASGLSIKNLIQRLKQTNRWTFQIFGTSISLESINLMGLIENYTNFDASPTGIMATSTLALTGMANYISCRAAGSTSLSDLGISTTVPNLS
jgi:hypothetical protein